MGRDPGTGKQVQRSVYGSSQSEVRKKLLELTQDRDDGKIVEPNKITLGEWLDTWQKEYLLNVRKSTADLYGSQIRLYLKPAFGSSKLCKLTNSAIQKKYREMSETLSPKSVKNIHGVLHKALDQAIKSGLIKSNPSDGCELPKIEKADIKPMSDEQSNAFLAAIKGHPYEVLYKTALFTGLRECELLGLKWDCVDFEKGSILVDKQLRKRHEKGGEYYYTPPKNGKSRTINPAPFVMSMLKAYKVQQTEQRLKCGPAWENSGLVFTTDTGGHLYVNTVFNRFKRIVTAIGCPDVRFHDLRHTYAVNSIRAGDDLKSVQGNLGHATAAFTLNVYGHFTNEMKQDSASRMDDFAKTKFNL